jgi:RNA polymerase sigma-70 factor (ECF subfamily)
MGNNNGDLGLPRRFGQKALKAVIAQYGGYVMAVALRVLNGRGTVEDAEEVTSDVFIALWNNAAKLERGSNLKGWLAVVARNTAIKKLRALQQHEELTSDTPTPLPANAYSHTAYGNTSEGTVSEPLARALDTLRPSEKELVTRFYEQEQDIAQIATEMGLTKSAVKNRLYRFRNKLRHQLSKGVADE